jgi:hypothetical protein
MTGITDPTEEYFKDGAWGHDGSQWRKLALLWGYSDVYAETESNSDADAGVNYLTFGAVPSGEVWVVTSVVGVNATTAACNIVIAPVIDSAERWVKHTVYAAVTRYVDWHGYLVLAAGDYLRLAFAACIAGDSIAAHACGYKMSVA